jgi:polyadenylate-binding protein
MQPGIAPQAAGPQGGTPHFASLYVGDLDPEVTEAMLYEIFNTVGPVASIRVCRDSVTRRSLGYAYVNFHSTTDAERVMDTLNYSTIKGRCCRIMWSHRDPNLRKTGNGNVFVKNLDKNVDNKALYDTFSLFGNILSCKVAADSEGKSRGYGFVHYETTEAAKQAIEKVNNMQIGEKTVFVGEFLPRDGRAQPEVTNFTNLYVKNLPESIQEEEQLLEMFKEFGTVTSSMLQKDKKDRFFAFVNMEKAEEAKAAIEALHKKDIRTEEEQKENPVEVPENVEDDPEMHPEHLMFVSRAMSKAERETMLKNKFKANNNVPVGVNLYIKNLPDDCADEELRSMFTPYGEITSARVMTDAKGRSKGFGFVCYKTPDEATKAVTEMHLKTVKGKPLYVGLAEKKDERGVRLANRYKGEKGAATKGGLVTFDGSNQMGKGGPTPGMAQMGMGMKGAPMQQNAYAQQAYGMQQGKGMQGAMINPMMAGMQQRQMQYGMPSTGPMGQRPMQFGMAPGQQHMAMQQMMGAANPMAAAGMKGMNPMMNAKGMNPMMNPKGLPGGKGAMMNGAQGAMPGAQPGALPGGKDGLTAQQLAQAPPGMQKQMLGEKLYPAVSRLQPDLAGKITGMMLEMDNSELLMMLESETQLKQKVDEAMRVLNQMPQGGR